MTSSGKIVVSDGLAMPGKALAAQRGRGDRPDPHQRRAHPRDVHLAGLGHADAGDRRHLLPEVPSVGDRAGGRGSPASSAAIGPGHRAPRDRAVPRLDEDPDPDRRSARDAKTDDFVLFSGHVDSWHYGAMDNGTANATQLEVGAAAGGAARRAAPRRAARLLVRPLARPLRQLRPGTPIIFWHDLHERCVCHVNVDSVGAKGASILEEAPVMAETYGFGRQVLHEHGRGRAGLPPHQPVERPVVLGPRHPDALRLALGAGAGRLARPARRWRSCSAAAARAAGSAGGGTPPRTRSTRSTPTISCAMPGSTPRRSGGLCTVPRLPFDYAATADELAETLARYHDAARGQLDLSGRPDLALDLGKELREWQARPPRSRPGQRRADRAWPSLDPGQLHPQRPVRARPRAWHLAAAGIGGRRDAGAARPRLE